MKGDSVPASKVNSTSEFILLIIPLLRTTSRSYPRHARVAESSSAPYCVASMCYRSLIASRHHRIHDPGTSRRLIAECLSTFHGSDGFFRPEGLVWPTNYCQELRLITSPALRLIIRALLLKIVHGSLAPSLEPSATFIKIPNDGMLSKRNTWNVSPACSSRKNAFQG